MVDLGLTDRCKITSGNDDELPKGSFDVGRLRQRIELFRPRIVAFTSKNAGRAFFGRNADLGWQMTSPAGTKFYVLPSTSPGAAWQWKQTSVHWRTLAHAVRTLRSGGSQGA